MATRNLSIVDRKYPNCTEIVWTGLLNGDDGQPAEYPHFSDKTVHVTGTLGAGGSVNIEGSNDGTNYAVLTDPQGNALTFTAVNQLKVIAENPHYIRPDVTTGDGTTDFSVTIMANKGAR